MDYLWLFFCHSICHQVFTIALFDFLHARARDHPVHSIRVPGNLSCSTIGRYRESGLTEIDVDLPLALTNKKRKKPLQDARRNVPPLRKSKRHIGWWPCSVIPTKAQRSKHLRHNNTIQTCPLLVKITYVCWWWTMLNNYFVAIVWLVKLRQTTSFHQFVLVESTPFHSVFVPSFRRR